MHGFGVRFNIQKIENNHFFLNGLTNLAKIFKCIKKNGSILTKTRNLIPRILVSGSSVSYLRYLFSEWESVSSSHMPVF